MNEHKIPSSESTKKMLFSICLFAFLWLNLYGILKYKLRFEVEGSSWFTIWMADGGLGIAGHRFAFALLSNLATNFISEVFTDLIVL